MNFFILFVSLFTISLTVLKVNSSKLDTSEDGVTFTLSLSNLAKENFYLNKSTSVRYLFNSDESSTGRISLFIEKMHCDPGSEDDEFRGLRIRSSSGEWKICSSFDYNENVGLDTYYKFSGADEYEIIREGNWTSEINAYLRVSMFTVSAKCSECPKSTFCCGTSRYCQLPEEDARIRCIPDDLLCDSYLDCGRRCDADESTQQCVVFFYFMEWNLMYTFVTILIFAILIPALVITGINLHRKSQASRRNIVIRQQNQGRNRSRVSIVAMDLPPPNYMDVQLNTKDASLPCFCQAVTATGGSHERNNEYTCTCKK